MAAGIKELVHPLVVRVTHWINVVAVLLMIASGWRIYNADPIFDFSFPDELTLGGWLAGALQWHFAAMWLLALKRPGVRLLRHHLGALQEEIAADLAACGAARCARCAARPARA